MITKIDRLFITDQLPDLTSVKAQTRRFYMERLVDVSGISGTGIVAVGVEFPSGFCVLEWQTETATIEFSPSIDNIITVHGHNGNTKIYYLDQDLQMINEMGIQTPNTEAELPAFIPLESSEEFVTQSSDEPIIPENYHAPENQSLANAPEIEITTTPSIEPMPTIDPVIPITPQTPKQETPEDLKSAVIILQQSLANTLALFNQYVELKSVAQEAQTPEVIQPSAVTPIDPINNIAPVTPSVTSVTNIEPLSNKEGEKPELPEIATPITPVTPVTPSPAKPKIKPLGVNPVSTNPINPNQQLRIKPKTTNLNPNVNSNIKT